MKSLMKYVLLLATFLAGANLLAQNVSTGIDNAGNAIAIGATDPNWIISAGPEGPATKRVATYPGAWQPTPVSGTNACWINGTGVYNDVPGNYTFDRPFVVAAGTTSFTTNISVAADDQLLSIELVPPSGPSIALPTPTPSYMLCPPIVQTVPSPMAGTWRVRARVLFVDYIGAFLLSGNINQATAPCNCQQLNPQFTYSVSADCVATFVGNPGTTSGCFAGATYDWYIDGSPAGSGQTFSYPFGTSGGHVVCLQITSIINGKVCQKRICQDVFIQCNTAPCTCDQLQPAYTFNIDKCNGQFISIGNIPPCLQNVGIDWFVNGVYSGSGSVFNYTFPSNGTYTVCLRISGTINGVKCVRQYCSDVQVTDCGGCDCSLLSPYFDLQIDKCTGTFLGGGSKVPDCLQPVSYDWYVNGSYVGSGINFTYVFPGNGGYVVCLRITGNINGVACVKEFCRDVSIQDCNGCNCDDLQPVFDYNIDKCVGNFFGGGQIPSCMTNVTYNWYVNGSPIATGVNFTYTFPSNGTYTVCLIIQATMPDGSICQREYCKDVQVTECDGCDCSQLQAYFDYQIDKCTGHFTSGSGIPECLQNVALQWYVNGVFVNTGSTLTYTFPGNGVYTVCLRIYANTPDGNKCYSEYCRDVEVTDCGDCDCEHVVPYFDFQVDKCVGTFYGSGNIPSCMTNVSFNWFVNGTYVGSGSTYSYTFSGNGTYNVCLHIVGYINGALCEKVFCRDVTVTDCSQCDCNQLQPDFSFQTEGCVGYFSGGGNIPSCMTSVVYRWYVNGSYVGAGQNFAYTFSGNGTYTVCLRIYGVINGIRCVKEICKTVTITNCGCSCEDIQPYFDFNVDGCIGHFFGGGAVPTCLQNVVYTWYVNGSPVGTGINFNYTFPGNGGYVVCLHITGNINGVKCDKQYCRDVVVQNCNGCDCKQLIPYYDFQLQGCFIQLIGNNSVVPACLSSVSYNWYVNGSYVGSGINFTYSFVGNGTYLVCLRITGTMPDGSICEKEFCRSIDVKDCGNCKCEDLQPYFDFNIDGCVGNFYGGGNIPGCLQNINFIWYVNGVIVGYGPTFSYTFPGNGGYVVCLHIQGTMPDGSICEKEFCRDISVTDCDGCSCADLVPHYIYKLDKCFGRFISNSVLPTCMQNVNYIWYVNGVPVGSGPVLNYTFPANGTYNVCLLIYGVVNGQQCVQQYCHDVVVTGCGGCDCNQLIPGFVYDQNGCFAFFNGFAQIPTCMMGVSYSWFVNGAFVGSGNTLSYNFPSNGSYSVCLVVVGFMPDGTICLKQICQNVFVQNCGGVGTPGNPMGMSQHNSGTPMEQSVLMYPNPTSSELNIQFNLEQDGPVQISVKSTDGKELMTESKTGEAGLQRFHLSLPASVTDGFVFVEIQAGGMKIVRKVSVVRH